MDIQSETRFQMDFSSSLKVNGDGIFVKNSLAFFEKVDPMLSSEKNPENRQKASTDIFGSFRNEKCVDEPGKGK